MDFDWLEDISFSDLLVVQTPLCLAISLNWPGVIIHLQNICIALSLMVLLWNQLWRVPALTLTYPLLIPFLFLINFVSRSWIYPPFSSSTLDQPFAISSSILLTLQTDPNQLLQTQSHGQVKRCSEFVARGPKIPRNPKSTCGLVAGIDDPLSHSAKETLIGRARGRWVEESS